MVVRPGTHPANARALDVIITAGDGNPSYTLYAIQVTPSVSGNMWVQADGSIGALPIYQPANGWAMKRATGLDRNTAYTFRVVARNGEDIDTAPGPGTTLSTLDNAAPGTLALSFPSLQGDMANLMCQVSTPSVDPDGDAVVYAYDWYRKPSAGSFALFRHDDFSAATQSTVSNTDTQVDDQWYCVVTPSDTDLSGTPVDSVHCTIVLGGTTPSAISLVVKEPSSITLGQSVTVSGQITPTPTGSGTVAFHSVSPSGTASDLFPEGTIFTSGQYTKTFYPNEASEGRTAWSLTSNWPGDATYMTATSIAANITVAKAQPSVSLVLNASSAPVNYANLQATVTFTTGFPSELSSLCANRTVKLYTKKPNGASLTPLTKMTDATGTAVFLPSDFVAANWIFDMPGTWQFRADFAGDNDFRPAASTGYDLPESVRLTLKDRAGYAIIVQGKYNALGEGQVEHAKTTDGVYRVLRARGIATEDIYYFRGAPSSIPTDIVVSDTTPTKAEVAAKVTEWARDKLRAAAAPLYIVFVDHGSVNKFYVYSGAFDATWYITPADLDGWLDTLETSLVGYPAANEKRVFVYGGCHFGSFIPVVSGAGRVVVTSTVTEQVSHRGVMDPADNRRDGEAFTTELFRELLGGKTLRVAFETASGKMAEYTANATNGSGATETQRPAYDDNGDGAATSGGLSPLPGQDGAVGHVLTLGYGVNEAGWASWTGVTPTVTLTIGAPMATLEGLCDKRPANNCTAWVEVKSPAYAGGTPIAEGTPEEDRAQEVALTRFDADEVSSDLANGIFRWPPNVFGTAFNTAGTYKVFYFVQETDPVTQKRMTSTHLVTTVYRESDGNEPPPAPELVRPEDTDIVHTPVLLLWNEVSDPDGVTYRVEVDEDGDFGSGAIVRENLESPYIVLGPDDGVLDARTYHWRVYAVDGFGAVSADGAVWTFTVQNVNPDVPGTLLVKVNDSSGRPMTGVTVQVMGQPQPAVSNAPGTYYQDLEQSTYSVQITKPDYATVELADVGVLSGEVTQRQVQLLSTQWNGWASQPQPHKGYTGTNHTFSVTPACGPGLLTFQWKWDDGSKAEQFGPATQTWALTNLTPAHAGTYWCEVTYEGTPHETNHVTLEVADHLAITQNPTGGTVNAGSPFTFTVQTEGGFAPLSYQWKKDGTAVPGAPNANQFPIPYATPSNAGAYTVTVSDAKVGGDILTSDEAQLTVAGQALPIAGALALAILAALTAGIGLARSRWR